MTPSALKQRIRAAKRTQTAYWETLEAAVNFAAGQVRDKRLDELERPKGVSGQEIIIDILFSIAIGPAAGILVEKFFVAMLKPVLRTRSVLFKVEQRSLEMQAITADGIRVARKMFQQSRTISLTQRSDDRKLLRDAATKLVTSLAGVGLEQAKRKLKEPSTRPLRRQGPGGDSPAVLLQTFVHNYALEQMTAIEAAHDELEFSLDDPSASEDLLAQIEGLLSDNLEDQAQLADLPDVLELYKRFFEACIWVSLFDVDQLRRKRFTQRTYYGEPVKFFEGYEWTAPESLVDYWSSRFPHDGFGADMSFDEMARSVEEKRKALRKFMVPASTVDQLVPPVSVPDALIKYFHKIEEALQNAARDFGVSDALLK